MPGFCILALPSPLCSTLRCSPSMTFRVGLANIFRWFSEYSCRKLGSSRDMFGTVDRVDRYMSRSPYLHLPDRINARHSLAAKHLNL